MSRTSTASSSRRNDGDDRDPFPVPERPEEIREALESLGVRPTKGWGQSFLTDPFVADAEAALVEVTPGRPVLEIGGGLGILTAALVRRGVRPLTVVERDARLAAHLRTVFGGRVQVLEGDALTVPLPPADVVIGNLPYSVATPILLAQFARRVPRVVFLVQDEVAQRLAARPGSRVYGRLSIIAQLYGSVELFRSVPPGSFSPVPEVSSRIGVHAARAGDLPVPSVPEFESLVRTLFSARRKQLGNLLPRVVPSTDAARQLAKTAGWPEDWSHLRPENLSPEAYFALARAHHVGRRAA
ncbi:MAG TPA: 16S rRNA (adenine(1518)-N(6)/adenine(1519)-N(6))-dimethyltransferase RsmA [Thermoplasmata archaeon]|nr:16S rRNA (adenine(1518)-N(6)/adenine(1519)-N(6))-dimethyltransferase RsmA [Thermoplasmata archaeon]